MKQLKDDATGNWNGSSTGYQTQNALGESLRERALGPAIYQRARGMLEPQLQTVGGL